MNDMNLLIILGDELLEAITEIQADIKSIPIYITGKTQGELHDRFLSLDDLLIRSYPVPVSKAVRQNIFPTHPLCFIYTSGTTGMYNYISVKCIVL